MLNDSTTISTTIVPLCTLEDAIHKNAHVSCNHTLKSKESNLSFPGDQDKDYTELIECDSRDRELALLQLEEAQLMKIEGLLLETQRKLCNNPDIKDQMFLLHKQHIEQVQETQATEITETELLFNGLQPHKSNFNFKTMDTTDIEIPMNETEETVKKKTFKDPSFEFFIQVYAKKIRNIKLRTIHAEIKRLKRCLNSKERKAINMHYQERVQEFIAKLTHENSSANIEIAECNNTAVINFDRNGCLLPNPIKISQEEALERINALGWRTVNKLIQIQIKQLRQLQLVHLGQKCDGDSRGVQMEEINSMKIAHTNEIKMVLEKIDQLVDIINSGKQIIAVDTQYGNKLDIKISSSTDIDDPGDQEPVDAENYSKNLDISNKNSSSIITKDMDDHTEYKSDDQGLDNAMALEKCAKLVQEPIDEPLFYILNNKIPKHIVNRLDYCVIHRHIRKFISDVHVNDISDNKIQPFWSSHNEVKEYGGMKQITKCGLKKSSIRWQDNGDYVNTKIISKLYSKQLGGKGKLEQNLTGTYHQLVSGDFEKPKCLNTSLVPRNSRKCLFSYSMPKCTEILATDFINYECARTQPYHISKKIDSSSSSSNSIAEHYNAQISKLRHSELQLENMIDMLNRTVYDGMLSRNKIVPYDDIPITKSIQIFLINFTDNAKNIADTTCVSTSQLSIREKEDNLFERNRPSTSLQNIALKLKNDKNHKIKKYKSSIYFRNIN